MLWQLDAGRKILRVPGVSRRHGKYLGTARTWRAFRLKDAGAGAVDDGSDECRQPGGQPRWQEIIRAGMEAARRASALRREIGAIHAVPFGIVSDGAGLLAG